ncbi:ImmA/IrrE family metallo-endopeptidase [Mesorhizobium sp. IMUNJ 23033]|uniref:ImmA/IrrE family metallo-endopeptidase n=1 Tax=Mesorhizobium sp. IMUNJ 23033 TaxID=3378039 RepID=UPI00384F6604
MAARSMTLESLADLLGESSEFTSQLLTGDVPIDNDIAESLADILGASKAFWLEREVQFRTARERARSNAPTSSPAEWLGRLPISDMKKFGWISSARGPENLLAECLRFFDVGSLVDWEATYRPLARAAAYRLSKSYVSDPMSIVTWLRFVETKAQHISANNFDAVAFRKALPNLRALTLLKDPKVFMPKLRELCAACGVALVVAPTPQGCPASGATRLLSSGTAMIALSLRYKTDDQFWFTFFHEAGHLLLHSDRAFFLEDGSDVTQTEEDEANEFSANLLVPSETWERLSPGIKDFRSVVRQAVSIGTSPGILVGQMQHKGHLRFNQLNFLKRRLSWHAMPETV